MECFSLANPNPTLGFLPFNSSKLPPSSMASFSSFPATSPFCLQSELLHRRRRTLPVHLPVAKGLAGLSLTRKRNVSVVSFATSQEDSKPSEAEIEVKKNDLKQAGKAFQEAWEQALASLKELDLMLESDVQELYEEYWEETEERAEKWEIKLDELEQRLTVLAEEKRAGSKEFLARLAEISPKPVKDVVGTFLSADNLDDISNIWDFYIGISYGAILFVGGFLDFMITGSISAIKFGVIIGGILLALSASSLWSWRRWEANNMTLNGQTAISGILFLRQLHLLDQGLTFVALLKTAVSGAVALHFMYRIISNNPQK